VRGGNAQQKNRDHQRQNPLEHLLCAAG
jgi:hypothetical protein